MNSFWLNPLLVAAIAFIGVPEEPSVVDRALVETRATLTNAPDPERRKLLRGAMATFAFGGQCEEAAALVAAELHVRSDWIHSTASAASSLGDRACAARLARLAIARPTLDDDPALSATVRYRSAAHLRAAGYEAEGRAVQDEAELAHAAAGGSEADLWYARVQTLSTYRGTDLYRRVATEHARSLLVEGPSRIQSSTLRTFLNMLADLDERELASALMERRRDRLDGQRPSSWDELREHAQAFFRVSGICEAEDMGDEAEFRRGYSGTTGLAKALGEPEAAARLAALERVVWFAAATARCAERGGSAI